MGMTCFDHPTVSTVQFLFNQSRVCDDLEQLIVHIKTVPLATSESLFVNGRFLAEIHLRNPELQSQKHVGFSDALPYFDIFPIEVSVLEVYNEKVWHGAMGPAILRTWKRLGWENGLRVRLKFRVKNPYL